MTYLIKIIQTIVKVVPSSKEKRRLGSDLHVPPKNLTSLFLPMIGSICHIYIVLRESGSGIPFISRAQRLSIQSNTNQIPGIG